MADNGLTLVQNKRLKALEANIEKGAADIAAKAGGIAESLSAIRDEKLYLANHKSFADYCRERWGISEPRAYQLLKHGQVLKLLDSTVVESVSERATREVSHLPPDEAAQVIVDTAQRTGGTVTSTDVQETLASGDPFADESDPFGEGERECEGGRDADGTDSDGGQDAPQEPPPGRRGMAGTSRGASVPRTPAEEWRLLKAKTIKTAEALMRALSDLKALRPYPEHKPAINACKVIIEKVKNL